MASAAALAATIDELLSNPEALRSCRDEGLKRVQSLYTEHRYVESHLALYQRLLQT
jgi:glycosyltransferase involved in cell wall biosynthesis